MLIAGALIVAACSGGQGDDEGVASLTQTESTTQTTVAEAAEVDVEQAMLDFTQCLRDEGIDIPDPEINADGRLNFRQLAEGAEDLDQDELRAAFQACQSELEGITLGGAGFDRTAIQDTLVEYAACMRENGYDMEDPDLSDFGPGPGGSGQPPGGPFASIDPDDPDFIAANEVCQQVFIGAVPRILGGEGRGPGGGG